MCRLFGMATGPFRARATFWLLEAPDSLARQARHEPDGTGLGWFDEDRQPHVDKAPIPAFEDEQFGREAREVCSDCFLAHVRFASTGDLRVENTHPFEQHGRLLAHNGAFLGLDQLDEQLGDYRSLVHGETDSERFFALVTKEIDSHDGDVTEGLAAAARWVAGELPLFALNVILASDTELWALRYPDTHDLFMLERAPGGPSGHRHLDHSSRGKRIHVRSGDLAEEPAVVFATERMDEDAGWRNLAPGELMRVDAELDVQTQIVLPDPPAHQLTLADLDPRAAAAQGPRI